ncbi:10232_t:CDS:1, partial [Rhizophagus irregularis]
IPRNPKPKDGPSPSPQVVKEKKSCLSPFKTSSSPSDTSVVQRNLVFCKV